MLGLTRSKYYQWRQGKPARLARKEADTATFALIEAAHAASKDAYGSPRITVELREVHGLDATPRR